MAARGTVSPSRLLEIARTRRVILRVRGDTLTMDGPPAALRALRPALRAAKPELVALLHARAWRVPPGDQVPAPGSPYRCHACWRRFPEAQLTVVNEPLGRGFRCVDCLRSE
jgi:hypothetical protein